MKSSTDTTGYVTKAPGLVAAIGSSQDLSGVFATLEISSDRIYQRSIGNEGELIWIAASSVNAPLYSTAEEGDWLVAVFGYFYCRLDDSSGPEERSSSVAMQVAHGLNEHGAAYLSNLDGAFAMIALRLSTSEVFTRADPGGVRKIFTSSRNGLRILSNKLHLIASICGKEEDTEARNFYLVYGYHPLDHTVYRRVKRLSGAHVHRIDGQELCREPALNPSNPRSPIRTDFEQALGELHFVLRGSMEAQLSRNRRIAVWLGGFDSSLVASLAKEIGLEVETFSFYYDDPSFNQTHTDTLADYLGIKHNWVRIDHKVIANGLRVYDKIFDQPTNWANYPIQTAYLTQEIQKRGFEAIITGDGCDGAFYGYPGVYKSLRLSDRSIKLPKSISRSIARLLSLLRLEELGGHPIRVFLRLIRMMSYENPERTYFMYRFLDETSIAKLTEGNYAEIEAEIATLMERIGFLLPPATGPALAYMGRNAAAPSKVKLAGCGDLSGLPIFSPYMHPSVLSLIKTFPDEWLRPDLPNKSEAQIGKYILVQMTQRYKLLPASIVYQKKIAAVDAPADKWYKDELREQILEMVRDLPFDYSDQYINGLLRRKALEKFYTKHFSSDSLTTHALMLLVTYSTYFRNSRKMTDQ